MSRDIKDGELNLDNYIFVRKDRETRIGGGVGCFIREDIKWQRRIDLESAGLETLWLEIFVKNSKSLLICILYRPPNSSKHLHKDFESILQDMLSTGVCEDKETILLGDLNVDYLRQQNNKEIKHIINVNGLKQIIKAPTRITKDSKTLIDVIATTHEQNIANSITYANSISDHDLVGIVMKKNNRKFTPRRVRKRNFAKYNVTAYKNDLAGQNWDSVYKEQDDNNAWNSFKTVLKAVMDKHAPFTDQKVRGRDCPWLSSEIRSKIHERDYWLKRARKSGKELDWSTYRRLRNVVTRLIRNSKSKYTRNLFRENVNTPNNFGNTLRNVFPQKK